MKLKSWGIAALAACLVAAGAHPLRAGEQDELGPVDMASEMEQSEFGTYNSCNSCPTGGGYGSGGMLGGLMGNRPIQIVAGAEYIYAQATFSEALAYVEQDPISGGETFHQIDFGYNSSYSFYGGFYLPDCGGALIFDYTRLTSDGSFAASETSTTDIFGPFEIDGNIAGHASVDLKSYDLGVAKTIPLGCLLSGAQCGDSCDDACAGSGCDGCGGGWCPAWDITWSGGVRFANVGWNNGLTAFDPNNNNAVIDSANTTLNFDGFGGRVGIMGRRYIGQRGLFSLYAKGDFSVLFGNVDLETVITNVAGSAFLRTSNDITVPVTEVELGGSAHLGAHATLSAGYFWSAWHDLGMSPTYSFDAFQISHFDDANILGFNGLFARAEVAF
jgi:hypothetical protein